MHDLINLQKYKEQFKIQALELKKAKSEKQKSLNDLRDLIAKNRSEINALKTTIASNQEQIDQQRALIVESRRDVSSADENSDKENSGNNSLGDEIHQKNQLLIKKYESFLYGDALPGKKGIAPSAIILELKTDFIKLEEKNKSLARNIEFLMEENRELESKKMFLEEKDLIETAESRTHGENRITGTNEFSSGLESFLVTYSDLITLILVIFVLLYSVSQVDHEKFSEAFSSFQEKEMQYDSFNVRLNNKEFEMLNRVRELVKDNVDPETLIRSDVKTVLIRLKSSDLFTPGSAELIPGAEELIIDSIKDEMQDGVKQVTVDGHTDDVPLITNDKYPTNWELSSVRASHVARVLIDKFNFSPDRMVVTGYGQYRPIKPNNSDLNRGLNRRVEIKILKDIQVVEESKDLNPAKIVTDKPNLAPIEPPKSSVTSEVLSQNP